MVRAKQPFGTVYTLFLSTDPVFDLLPVSSLPYSSPTEHNTHLSLQQFLLLCCFVRLWFFWGIVLFCFALLRGEILPILTKFGEWANISGC